MMEEFRQQEDRTNQKIEAIDIPIQNERGDDVEFIRSGIDEDENKVIEILLEFCKQGINNADKNKQFDDDIDKMENESILFCNLFYREEEDGEVGIEAGII